MFYVNLPSSVKPLFLKEILSAFIIAALAFIVLFMVVLSIRNRIRMALVLINESSR